MLLRWLIGLLRRHSPQEGWFIFLLPLLTLLTLPVAVYAAEWVDGLAWLLARVVMLGYVVAFGLTRIGPDDEFPAAAEAGNGGEGIRDNGRDGRNDWGRAAGGRSGGLPGWAATLVLAVAGLTVVSLVAGWQVAPQVPAGLRWYLRPSVRAGLVLLEMGRRLQHWGSEVLRGGAAQDDIVFGWLTGLLAWSAATWAGWWAFRHRNAMLGLLPAGFLLALQLFFAWVGRGWLPVFLGGLTLTVVSMRRYALEQRWQRHGMDYSQEMRLDTALTALGLAALVIVLSATMPRLVVKPTARWFYKLMADPVARMESTGKRLFPELRRAPRSLLATGGAPGELPRSFLLGSGPELGQKLVLRVTTSDLKGWRPGEPAPERQYWRALTYDTYDGRGWRNGPVSEKKLEAGEPWTEGLPPLRRPLRQEIEVLRAGDRALYAAGEPLAANRSYKALLRSGLEDEAGDLVALLADSRRYEVISLVPAAGEADLRAAGQDYPDAVRQRYLTLPKVPSRVVELAQALTEGLANPYDQALALESYLRTYRYDLDVSAPPANQDVADYFLFDLKAGYCDYYATAMVVMARSLGIPARLAVGYATGDLNAEEEVYLVAEDSAHSWPELYFPGVGWVPFEPTAARPVFVRRGLPTREAEAMTQQPALEAVDADLQRFREDEIVRRRLRWVIGVPLGLLLGGLAAWLWQRRPEPSLGEMYAGLGRWGERLGRPPGAGETAGEFGRGLSSQLRSLGGQRGRQAARGVVDFVHHFEGALYGLRRDEERRATLRSWLWLRSELRGLWMRWWVRRWLRIR